MVIEVYFTEAVDCRGKVTAISPSRVSGVNVCKETCDICKALCDGLKKSACEIIEANPIVNEEQENN